MNRLNGDAELVYSAVKKFEDVFGSSDYCSIMVSPASLILLGDHTHYNEGILLSLCANRFWVNILRKRKDNVVCIASADSDRFISTTLEKVDNLDGEEFKLLRGLTKSLFDQEIINCGFDCVIASNIPECFGLGSLAGMQISFINNMKKVFTASVEDSCLLDSVKKNENKLVGKFSNVSHHLTAQYGKEGKILQTDLRQKVHNHINLGDREFNLVVCDTNEKIASPQELCNERVEECEIGVKGLRLYIWGIKNLRDVESDFLLRHYHMLPRRIFNRVLYNVNERKRAENAVKFLKKNQMEDFGVLVTESHWALSNDFEIGNDQVDYIVTEAVKLPGVLCSKMISCSPIKSVFNIVDVNLTENFITQMRDLYKNKFNSELTVHNMKITSGVRKISTKDLIFFSN
jgi:galactokinase